MSVICVVNADELGAEVLRLGRLAAESMGIPLVVVAVDKAATQTVPDAEVTTLPENQDEADAVLDLSIEKGSSLIVVGVRRRSPVGKFLLGSAAQRIILEAEVPVLTVKEPRHD